MLVKQGRVVADSPGEAAMKIRDKTGYSGRLVLKRVAGFNGKWYEYTIRSGEDED